MFRFRLRTLLFVFAIGPPALANDPSQDDPFKLAESAKVLLAQGHKDRGLDLLRRADAIASKGMEIPDFMLDEPLALSAERLDFGTRQVRNMLADRPNMATGVKEDDAIFRWAARKFGGENLLNRLYWSNRQPKTFDALHYPPTAEWPGEIQIKLASGNQNDSRPFSFERLWSCAIFELNNAANAADIGILDKKMREGSIGRTAFVEGCFRLEHLAAAKTRRFYVSVFSQQLKAESLDTSLDRWFFTDSYLGNWQRALRFYNDPGYYPWSYFGRIYDAYEAARIAPK